MALTTFSLSAYAPDAAANKKYAAMVYDVKSGKTLFSRSANAARFPASLTKIMTLFIVFEELEAGRMKKSTRIRVSKRASKRPPSKLGFKPGQTLTVDSAIRALVTKSANDVASAVAEHISGTEYKFAQRMTRTARRLGMTRTTFRNASGLPDANQRTTASDMIKLAQAVQQTFPQHYRYFSLRSFKFRGRAYRNHNKLLGRVRGVDGIKTGYIRASGFNLVTSVKTGGRHIVAVVMGGRTGASRNRHMSNLIGSYLPRASKRQTAKLRYSPGSKKPLALAAPLPVAKPKHIADAAQKPSTKAANVTQSIATAQTTQSPQTAVAQLAASPGHSKRIIAEQTSDGHVLYRIVDETSADVGKLAFFPKTKDADRPSSRQETLSENSQQELTPGWQIQIAAVPSKTEAHKLLQKTRSVSKLQLASASSSSQRIERNGQVLYRARFVGFQSKTAARRACKSLKAKSIDCFTVYQ